MKSGEGNAWNGRCHEWIFTCCNIMHFSFPGLLKRQIICWFFLGFSWNWSSKHGLAVVYIWLWACNFAFVCFYLEASDCFGSLPDCPITCLWADNLSQLFTLVRRSLQTSPYCHTLHGQSGKTSAIDCGGGIRWKQSPHRKHLKHYTKSFTF